MGIILGIGKRPKIYSNRPLNYLGFNSFFFLGAIDFIGNIGPTNGLDLELIPSIQRSIIGSTFAVASILKDTDVSLGGEIVIGITGGGGLKSFG